MAGQNRSASRKQSGKIAFCGMMVALSVALMLTGGLIPIATYCAPMISGVLLLPILLEYGKKTAWMGYLATALIVLILVLKELYFFIFFWVIIRLSNGSIDKLHQKPMRVILKLLLFNGAVVAMYAVLGFVLHMDAVVEEFTEMGMWMLAAFIILLDICLFMYDRLLVPMTVLYANKLRPRLRFLIR